MYLDKIRETIRKFDMISRGDKVVVGFSGGPDSTCLLHSLAALREELGIQEIYAVHINHCLRGEEAVRDEIYSAALASKLGIDFFSFHSDISARAVANSVSTESEGRTARYAAFRCVCEITGAKKIAVAHNRNDQAETVLMRIMRGTGIHGLIGIEYERIDDGSCDYDGFHEVVVSNDRYTHALHDIYGCKVLLVEDSYGQSISCISDGDAGSERLWNASGGAELRDASDDRVNYENASGGAELSDAGDDRGNYENASGGAELSDASDDHGDYENSCGGAELSDAGDDRGNYENASGGTELSDAGDDRGNYENACAGNKNGAYSEEAKKIIRPLLDMNRNEIENYCTQNGLKPVIDSTNSETLYTRNKIRLQLLPAMRETFNPSVDEAIVRLSRSAAADDDFISSEAFRLMNGRWRKSDMSLDISGLTGRHSALLSRIVMIAAKQAGMAENLGEAQINALVEIVQKDTGQSSKEIDLLQGNYVHIAYGRMWFLFRKLACGQTYVEISEKMKSDIENGEVSELIFEGKKITIRLLSETECKHFLEEFRRGKNWKTHKASKESYKLFLDWDALYRLDENLVFRFRQAGDRIQPKGMKGHKKLQDFFTDRKIPKHLRDTILLLASGREIIIAGREISAACIISKEKTKKIVSIEIQ